MSDPLISVVIPNFNGRLFLEASLSSIVSQTYPNWQVIVVDDNSTDDSVHFITAKFPLVQLIKNDSNVGFAMASNIGLKHARGQYIFLLNNDAHLDPLCLERLMSVAETDSTIGMCACKVLRTGTGLIDSVGLIIYRDGTSRARGSLTKDQGQYDVVQEVLAPSGCAALYRKEMLDEVGIFDEQFYSFFEDLDLGLRARLQGWRAFLVPTAVVHHHHSGSWDKYLPAKWFLFERNRIWVAVKNFPLDMLLQAPLYSAFRYFAQARHSILRRATSAESKGRFNAGDLIYISAKANLAALRGLPKMLEKRKEVQSGRRISRRDIDKWFRDFGANLEDTVLTHY